MRPGWRAPAAPRRGRRVRAAAPSRRTREPITLGSSHSRYGRGASGKTRVHRRQPAELARHVVRGRRHRPERRTPDDDVGVAEADQVGEVRVAAGKLRDARFAATRRDPECRTPAAARAARRRGAPNRAARPAAPRAPSSFHARTRPPKLSCAPCVSTTCAKVERSSEPRLDAFMDEHVYPNERDVPSADRRRRSLAADGHRRGAEAEGARRRVCGICFCRRASTAPG